MYFPSNTNAISKPVLFDDGTSITIYYYQNYIYTLLNKYFIAKKLILNSDKINLFPNEPLTNMSICLSRKLNCQIPLSPNWQWINLKKSHISCNTKTLFNNEMSLYFVVLCCFFLAYILAMSCLWIIQLTVTKKFLFYIRKLVELLLMLIEVSYRHYLEGSAY